MGQAIKTNLQDIVKLRAYSDREVNDGWGQGACLRALGSSKVLHVFQGLEKLIFKRFFYILEHWKTLSKARLALNSIDIWADMTAIDTKFELT